MGGKWISRISRPRDFSRDRGSVACINILTLLRFSGPADGSSWTLAGPKRLSLPHPACQPAPRLPGTKCCPLSPARRSLVPGAERSSACASPRPWWARGLPPGRALLGAPGLGPTGFHAPPQVASSAGCAQVGLPLSPRPDPECPSLLPSAEPQLSEASVPSLLRAVPPGRSCYPCPAPTHGPSNSPHVEFPCLHLPVLPGVRDHVRSRFHGPSGREGEAQGRVQSDSADLNKRLAAGAACRVRGPVMGAASPEM